MTTRLKNTEMYLLGMSSRWFVVPRTNIPVNALARMLWDPIAVLEHMLEPQAETRTETNATPAPTNISATTIPLEPFTSSSSSTVVASLPRRVSAPKIVEHRRPLTKAPAIGTRSTSQPDNLTLTPFQSAQTAKAKLRSVKSHGTTVSAAAGEFSALDKLVSETPNARELSALTQTESEASAYSHADPTSSSTAVKSSTRMISGAPALTSLLAENIGKRSITEPHRETRSRNAGLPQSLEAPSSSRTATQAVRALRRESTRSPGTAFENIQQSQTTTLAMAQGAQHDEPAALREPPRAPQTLSAAVNYDEIMDELEQRLAVEFLRHYGTSGV